ncbi:MAG: helix-turn-helix transcriptional regulator, partial [Nocardiaceae bacterium]|nr:helix-turn-helix transcriptional regulator [Nocardiaceae bacterium]
MITPGFLASESTLDPVPPPARLLSRLGRNCPLVIVRAPHGFGKSALVAGWLRSGPDTGHLPVGIPPPDHPIDSDRYWEVVAMRLVSAGVIDPEAVRPGVQSWADTVRHVLSRASAPVRLALERVDLVDGPDLERQLLDLVDACHHVDVVVTMTGRPIFADPILMDPTHDLLDGYSLAFTSNDIRQFFYANSIGLSDDECELVRRLTGGLPSLMPIALREVAELPPLPHRFEVLRRYLPKALTGRIHATLLTAPDVAPHTEFLHATSTAHTLSVEVATFLGGGPGSTAHLNALEKAGVVEHLATTSNGDTWRLASAVRAALLDARREAGTDPTADLSRLAHYHLDRNDRAAALRCAAEASDWPVVADLLTAHWYDLLGSDMTAVHDVVFKLPDAVTTAFPRLRERRELLAGLDGAMTRHLPDPKHTDPHDETSAIIARSHRAVMLRLAGEYTRAAATTRHVGPILDGALAGRPDEQLTYILAFTRLQRGLTYQLDGDISASVGELQRAHRLGCVQGIDFIARNAADNLALNWAFVGEPQRAQDWLTYERDGSTTDTMTERLIEIGRHVARTLVALDSLDTGSARAALGKLQRLPPVIELWPYVVFARCRYAIASADPRSGLRALEQWAELRTRARGHFVTSLIDAVEIEVHLADGNGWRALQLAESSSVGAPWTVVAKARAHYVTGDHRAAIDTCRRFDWFSGPYTRSHLEALVIKAAALYSIGDETAAVQPWTRACKVAARTGIRGVFATVPRRVVEALHALTDESSPLVTEFLAAGSTAYYPSDLSLPALTDREVEVLASLVEGHTSHQIAANLVIS